jgi:hypothetical protein
MKACRAPPAIIYDGTTATAAATAPSSTTINVWLPHRLPGQLQGPGEPIVENRYRYYLPTLGQYLTPDPMHQASVMMPGRRRMGMRGQASKFCRTLSLATWDRMNKTSESGCASEANDGPTE